VRRSLTLGTRASALLVPGSPRPAGAPAAGRGAPAGREGAAGAPPSVPRGRRRANRRGQPRARRGADGRALTAGRGAQAHTFGLPDPLLDGGLTAVYTPASTNLSGVDFSMFFYQTIANRAYSGARAP